MVGAPNRRRNIVGRVGQKSRIEAAANKKKQAVEMRDRALARFGQTRKRHAEGKEGGKRKIKDFQQVPLISVTLCN